MWPNHSYESATWKERGAAGRQTSRETASLFPQSLATQQAYRTDCFSVQAQAHWFVDYTKTIGTVVVIRCFLACTFVSAGPLAAYVSVKDKRWLVPVQLALGNLCYAYWVDNHNDLMRLQTLVDRTFTNKSYRPSIIIQPHSVCVCCYNFFCLIILYGVNSAYKICKTVTGSTGCSISSSLVLKFFLKQEYKLTKILHKYRKQSN